MSWFGGVAAMNMHHNQQVSIPPASGRSVNPQPPERPSLSRLELRGWEMGPDGPEMTEVFVKFVLNLDPPARREINQILKTTYRESVALEQARSERKTEEGGQVVTTIAP